MASQEVDSAELGTAPASAFADGARGSHAAPQGAYEPPYQPADRPQEDQKGELQALGAVQILTGAMVLALGIVLGSLLDVFSLFKHYFFILYTAYPLWGAVLFICSGSLSVAAGRKPTRMLMQNSFGMNIASATIALVGIIFLSINLAVNVQALKNCRFSSSGGLCVLMGNLSNGLLSVMLLLTVLELCVTLAVSAMWCKANSCNSREAISSPPNSVESGMPPGEN
ncbi:PREDICTED: membrane-spanning 4-domains subfamily A member 3 [Condylura cristata]|uniref:membrane-spanning 4-domains subfamily A member 3 n=1 Tax=Condylura cristata TaxID=143302 RepID=UPI000334525F|nr:PREDICTED: membrane-spanning 4-domains subfamily A member 3 [Condylura cristata]